MEIRTKTHARFIRSPKTDRISDAARSIDTAGARDALTERSHRIWSAGDYDRIAAGFRDGAREFVERLSLEPGQLVLDAAAGSGNLTIPAARTGAVVTGIDLVPSLLSAAYQWAAREGLAVTLDLGTAELFRTAYGPTVSAFAALDENRRATFAADLAAHWA